MFEVEGTCYFWLGNYQDAINLQKLKIDTRDSLFYSAACYKKLGNNEKATEILKQVATNTLNMTTDKFLSSQPLKNEDSKKELQEIITAI